VVDQFAKSNPKCRLEAAMHADTGYRPGVSTLGPLLAIAMTVVLALPALGAGSLIISEFRLRGPNGAQDEFIEIYNDSASAHTVVAASGTGYGIAASDGGVRCSINNGTIIPARGHWLCTNSAGYSLAAYPPTARSMAPSATVATPPTSRTTRESRSSTTTPAARASPLANRFDAVGSTSEANLTYREGTGYPPFPSSRATFPSCATSAAREALSTSRGHARFSRQGTPTTTWWTSTSWTRTERSPRLDSAWERPGLRTWRHRSRRA
jgi:hypothetical protein